MAHQSRHVISGGREGFHRLSAASVCVGGGTGDEADDGERGGG